VPTRDVQDLVTLPQPQRLPDQVGLSAGELVVEPLLVEVEIVLAEDV
jgi:hypothetical protein